MKIANYTDALYYMTPQTRYNEATRILITEKLVQPGTPEYTELSNMRLQAKKDIMGIGSIRELGTANSDAFSNALEELYSDERSNYTKEREYYERD